MNNRLGSGYDGEGIIRMNLAEHYGPASHLGKDSRCTVKRSGVKCFSLVKKQMPEFGLAQPDGVLEHCIENGFKLTGRRADDAQHLRGCRLLLQRLGKFARALLLGLEQSHVFDSNRRLVGESLQELDLWGRKQPCLSTSDRNRPDSKIVANYWDSYDAAIFADHRHRTECVVGLRIGIRNLYETSFEYRACRRAPSTWRCGIRAAVHLEHLGSKAVVRHEVEELAVEPVHKAELAIAEPPSALGNHVEHRLDVGRGAADDLEDVGGSNLLLTRLVQLSTAIVELLPQIGGRMAAARAYLRTVPLRLSGLATPCFHRFYGLRCYAPSPELGGQGPEDQYPTTSFSGVVRHSKIGRPMSALCQ